MTIFYILAFISFFTGMFAIFTLVEKFPVKYIYYHYHARKPIVWTIFIGSMAWVMLSYFMSNEPFPWHTLPPLFIISLSVLMAYKVHQEAWFKAVDFPIMTKDIDSLPIGEESQLAIIEVNGIVKAYPLNYVIHHHIINDSFGDKIIALTYCAMCRSIIPFDVTDIGALFVGSFKNANLIVADRKTKTFFQQESFNSIIGKLHPHQLSMIPFHILSWSEVKNLNPIPEVVVVTKRDFRPFKLPMPGVWNKVMSSELTPGLVSKDKSFPSKTHIIGIIDPYVPVQIAYLKKELIPFSVVVNEEYDFVLIITKGSVNGFKGTLDTHALELAINDNKIISDKTSGTTWDLRGKYINGAIQQNLESIAITDEYWFAWKKFHPDTLLIRMNQ